MSRAGEPSSVAAELRGGAEGQVRGDAAIPLMPFQRWFFDQNPPDPQHWNAAVLLEPHRPPDVDLLERAARAVLLRHDALRLRFRPEGGGWRQWVGDLPEAELVREVDLSHVDDRELSDAFERVRIAMHLSLDLERGPILRLALVELGRGRGMRLHVVAHHGVTDALSMDVVLTDLQLAYTQLEQGRPVEFPTTTAPFVRWARSLADAARRGRFDGDAAYWLREPETPVRALPADDPDDVPLAGANRVVLRRLPPGETRTLGDRSRGIRVADLLVCALVFTLADWAGGDRFAIELYRHGREPLFRDVDVSRTVGPFLDLVPVVLPFHGANPAATLSRIADELAALPHGGISYGALRYLADDPYLSVALARARRPQIGFNYAGQTGPLHRSRLFDAAPESAGPFMSPRQRRPVPLLAIAEIVEEGLQVMWLYSSTTFHAATIEQLADRYLDAVTEVAGLAPS